MARSLTITPAQLGAAAACAPLGVAAAVALSALSSAVCGAAGAAPGPGSGSRRRRRATASATAPPRGGGDGSGGHEEGEVGGTIGPGATVLFVITVQMGCDGGNCCPPPLPTKSCLRLRLRLG